MKEEFKTRGIEQENGDGVTGDRICVLKGSF